MQFSCDSDSSSSNSSSNYFSSSSSSDSDSSSQHLHQNKQQLKLHLKQKHPHLDKSTLKTLCSMSETQIVKLAAKINKLIDHANIQRIGIPSDITVRREKFLQFIRTYKCALESFTVTSNILATFELDSKIHKPYTKSVDKALWKSLYGHIQSVTLDSLHEHHGSGFSMLLALQRKCANIDEDNREYLEDIFKSCRMYRNENATGYLTRLQNYSHKAKQAGAHITAER